MKLFYPSHIFSNCMKVGSRAACKSLLARICSYHSNNAIFNNQGKPNPFIDQLEYAAHNWGGKLPDKEEPETAPLQSNPTNDFSSSFITLNCTNATGEDLHTGYLILRSNLGFSSIPVPQNGKPPENYSPAKVAYFGLKQCPFGNSHNNIYLYFKIFQF